MSIQGILEYLSHGGGIPQDCFLEDQITEALSELLEMNQENDEYPYCDECQTVYHHSRLNEDCLCNRCVSLVSTQEDPIHIMQDEEECDDPM
jgi:hypothetical protein